MVTPSPSFEKIFEYSVYHDEKGMYFQSDKKTQCFSWHELSHVYQWPRKDVLTAIDVNGQVMAGNLFSEKWFKGCDDVDTEVENIWSNWYLNIDKQDEIHEFIYHELTHKEEFKDNLKWSAYPIILSMIIFFPVVMSVSFKEGYVIQGYALVSALPLISLLYGLYHLKQILSPKLKRIIIGSNKCKVEYKNHSFNNYSLHHDISHFYPSNTKTIGTLIFSDKTKLKHLERISYWPVFRQKILDALEVNQCSLKTE